MNRIPTGSATDSRSDLPSTVKRIGRHLLDFLACCGYPICFSRAGHDQDGDYAFFVIDISSLPKGVALRHLRSRQLIQLMEMCVHRDIAVVNNRGGINYIVPMQGEYAAISAAGQSSRAQTEPSYG